MCWTCKVRYRRRVTPAEAKHYAKYHDISRSFKGPGLHKIWHEFTRKFKLHIKTGETELLGKKVPIIDSSKWRWIGYELMTRVEKWAKRYPEDVRITGIDDDHFASSMLVLVEHRLRDQYMGTSVVVIPQCTGEAPIVFFMYPGHRNALAKTLNAIDRASKPVKAREREAAKLRDAEAKRAITLPKPSFQPTSEET